MQSIALLLFKSAISKDHKKHDPQLETSVNKNVSLQVVDD